MIEPEEPSAHQRVREGFPSQRLVVLPENVLQRCRCLPIVDQLHVTHIGAFPKAPHHFVERKEGLPQTILIYCSEGCGWLEMAGSTFSVRQCQVTIIPSGVPHTYRAASKDPWSVFWIHFHGLQAEQVTEDLLLSRKRPQLDMPDTRMMCDAFEDLYACLHYQYSDAGLLAMSGELIRLLAKIKLHHGISGQAEMDREDQVMSTVKFMHDHLDIPVSLEAFAARSGHSVPHYCKLFKQRTSQSPTAYFIQLKIRKACELLHETDQPVKDIAAQLGYEDPYYFSRIFKKVQGCSPLNYRESVKG